MKHMIVLLFLMVVHTIGKAENIIQVVPFETKAGITTDDMQSFSIEMRNSEKMLAFQFDILLPEGMSLDNTDGLDPFEFNEDRVSYTVDRRGNKTFDYLAEYSEPFDGGWITVMVFTLEEDGELTGLDGEIMRAYYLTDANMEPGVYPVRIRNTVIANADNTKKFKPGESTSYITIGESPLKAESRVELKELTGYIPSFTIEAMNMEMSGNSNITSLDISNADSIGAIPMMGNGLVQLSTSAAKSSILHDAANIVAMGTEGNTCKRLYLADGDRAFCSPCSFTATNASFDRVFKAGQWSTVCLPFNVPAEQFAKICDKGVEVERLVEYDAVGNILRFEAVTEMEANTPYIIKCNSDNAPFSELTNVGVSESDGVKSIQINDASMVGVFSTTHLDSDASVSYYGYNSADGTFVKIGSNGTVYPFRAFISIPSEVTEARLIGVEHGDGNVTGVLNTECDSSDAEVKVYALDGKLVRNCVDKTYDATCLPEGVYLIGSRKIIVK